MKEGKEGSLRRTAVKQEIELGTESVTPPKMYISELHFVVDKKAIPCKNIIKLSINFIFFFFYTNNHHVFLPYFYVFRLPRHRCFLLCSTCLKLLTFISLHDEPE